MYVRRELESKIVWFFSWRALLFFAVLATVAHLLYEKLHWTLLAIPFLPVATIGTAVAFYVGFKNNASYERLWEARKIFGEIEHLCRFWTMIILKTKNLGSNQLDKTRRELVYRQLAWVNSLRIQLRHRPTFHNEVMTDLKHVQAARALHSGMDLPTEMNATLKPFITEQEYDRLKHKHNIATELLYYQLCALDGIREEFCAEDYDKLLDTINVCSQQQAAAERINKFPFPRQYAHMSSVFVNIFILLLPFSLIGEIFKNDPAMSWLMVPFSILVSWVFYTMEKVGDTSENPFEGGLNDVPLNAICREIEIDLRTLLDEENLPELLKAESYILL